jgi:hypothetical protein
MKQCRYLDAIVDILDHCAFPWYDPKSQKEFFKNVVELFRQMSNSTSLKRVNIKFRLHGGLQKTKDLPQV